MTVGQVCAGHKNDLWFEAERRARVAALAAGAAERAVDRPPRRSRTGAAEGSVAAVARPAALRAPARRTSGSVGAMRSATCMRDIYSVHSPASSARTPPPAAFATFEDGYRAACARGRHSREPPPRRRLDEGRTRPNWTEARDEAWSVHARVRASSPSSEMLAKVNVARGRSQAIELGTGGWPGRDHLDLDALLGDKARAAALPADDRRRRPHHQRAVVPRQPAASGSRRRRARRTRLFRKTVRLAEQLRGAGRRHLLRLPRRLRRREASQLGDRPRGRRSFSRCSTGSGRRRRFRTGATRRSLPPITA